MSSKRNIAVSVRGLSKAFTIAHEQHKQSTLAETLLQRARKPFHRASKETFWALRDVSFDICKGEVVGIIGRNGAGKSTLLKVLSRITEPTTGQIDVYGRIGSLLEVGTGFHPELTGRENIFLNGAILGMAKTDIRRHFDAIVDFSGVETFLDTPVKRYSSGMYVRLAFAVAAHLEPEILIVDEVLAVGDAEFQKKCLGKMKDVAAIGRTVLFVSHNMQAVLNLCTYSVHLEAGRVVATGEPEKLIASYLQSTAFTSERIWTNEDCLGDEHARLLALRVQDEDQNCSGEFATRRDLLVDMQVNIQKLHPDLCIGFDILTNDGTVVFRTYQTDPSEKVAPVLVQGINLLRCRIPRSLLNAGIYTIVPRIGVHNVNWIVNTDLGITFETILNHGVSRFWTSLGDKTQRPGLLAPILEWTSPEVSSIPRKPAYD